MSLFDAFLASDAALDWPQDSAACDDPFLDHPHVRPDITVGWNPAPEAA